MNEFGRMIYNVGCQYGDYETGMGQVMSIAQSSQTALSDIGPAASKGAAGVRSALVSEAQEAQNAKANFQALAEAVAAQDSAAAGVSAARAKVQLLAMAGQDTTVAIQELSAALQQSDKASKGYQTAAAGARDTGKAMDEVSAKARGAGGALRETEGDAQKAGGAFGFVAANLGKIVAVVGLAKVAAAVKNLAAEGTALAARNQMMATSLRVVGKNAGWLQGEMDKAVQGVKSMGITTAASIKSVTSWIQGGLHMGKTADEAGEQIAGLARVAQDLAVVAGTNSSEAFERMMMAVQMGNARLLRTFGIVDQTTKILDRYAATIGKTAAELTDVEQRQAFVNRIMAEGAKVSGAYTEAMGDVAKQAGSMKRHVEAAKVEIGKSFLPVMEAGVQMQTKFWKALKGAAEELGPAMKKISSQVKEMIGQIDIEPMIKTLIGAVETVVKVIQYLSDMEPAALKAGAALVAFGLALPKLAVGFTAAKVAFLKMTAAMMTNPIFLIAAGIVAAGLAIAKVMDMVAKKQEETVAAMTEESKAISTTAQSYEEYREQVVAMMKEKDVSLHLGEEEALMQNAVRAGAAMTRREYAAATGTLIDFHVAQKRVAEDIALSSRSFLNQADAMRVSEQVIRSEMVAIRESNQVLVEAAQVRRETVDQMMVAATTGPEALAGMQEFESLVAAHAEQVAATEQQYEAQKAQAAQAAQFDALEREALFRQQEAALLAAGQVDKAAQLAQTHEAGLAQTKYNLEKQEQLNQQAQLLALYNLKVAHLEELREQQDQAQRSLILQVTSSEQFAGLSIAEQKARLTILYAGGSERLKNEHLFAEKQLEVQHQLAAGAVGAAGTIVEAWKATQADTIAAAEAGMNDAKAALEGFKIALPPLPPLDMSKITGSGARTSAARALGKATEPATAKIKDVLADINDGINEANKVIMGLADFEVPAGTEAKAKKLGIFVKQVFSVLAEAAGTADKEASKILKRNSKSIAKVVDSMKIYVQLSDQMGTPPDPGKAASYVEGFSAFVLHLMDSAQDILNQLGGGKRGYENIKRLQKVTRKMQKMIEALVFDTEKITDLKLPDMEVWKSDIMRFFRSVFGAVRELYDELGPREIAKAAEGVENLTTLNSLAQTEFSNLDRGRLPDLTVWKERFVAALRAGAEAIGEAVTAIGPLKLASLAAKTANLKSVLDLVTQNLQPGSVAKLSPEAWKEWGAAAAEILKQGASVIGDAADAIGDENLDGIQDKVSKLAAIRDFVTAEMKLPATQLTGRDWSEWAAWLKDVLKEGTTALNEAADSVGREAVDSAAEIGGKVKKVFDVLGVDLMQATGVDKNWGTRIQDHFAALKTGLGLIVPFLKEIEEDVGADVLEQYAKTSKFLQDIVGVLTSGALFADLKDMSKIDVEGLAVGTIQALRTAIEAMGPEIALLNASVGNQLPAIAKTVQQVSEITGGLSEIAQNIDKAWEAGEINIPMLARIMRQFTRAADLVAVGGVLPGTTVTAPTGDGVGGGSAGAGAPEMVEHMLNINVTVERADGSVETYVERMSLAEDADRHMASLSVMA